MSFNHSANMNINDKLKAQLLTFIPPKEFNETVLLIEKIKNGLVLFTNNEYYYPSIEATIDINSIHSVINGITINKLIDSLNITYNSNILFEIYLNEDQIEPIHVYIQDITPSDN